MKPITQEQQVVNALLSQGGVATLRRLNEIIDFSSWKTLTPTASVRRIVQESNRIFKIRPGLWALEECRDAVLKKFNLEPGNESSEELFSHSYFQGLLIEIGHFRGKSIYVPSQDKSRLFLDQTLGEMTDYATLPPFTYDHLLKRARTIDVIWFNNRQMPSHLYEVEHTTDIKNSLSKFYELQDFHAGFYIVASNHRLKEFEDKIGASMFDDIRDRVKFLSYDKIAGLHSSLKQQSELIW